MLLLATAAIGGPLWAHIGSMLFVPGLTGGGGSLVVSSGGTADNKDNAFVVGKLRTTKFTLAMVAEWATIMGDWCLVMDPNWAPRDKDEEAVALSNFDFGHCDGSIGVPVVREELRLDVVNVDNVLLCDGEAFGLELQKENEGEAARKELASEAMAPREYDLGDAGPMVKKRDD
jgi:hypothetical protein